MSTQDKTAKINLEMADKILSWLASQSVSTICLCPGGRNAPFVAQLDRSEGFEILNFYDERSAGFFALGRARRDGCPVAVITTSGTAVTEVMSSVVEATYSETPLVVVSADRPKILRGTGAPQTIEQHNIFGTYVENSIDLETTDTLDFEWKKEKPFHINVCFDEPLLGEENVAHKAYKPKGHHKMNKTPVEVRSFKRPLVVLGGMSAAESANVEKCLADWSGPIFAESLSGLKNSKILKDRLLKSSDPIVDHFIKQGLVQTIVRIGDIPVGRYWRDLDRYNILTISISSKNYRGMALGELIHTDLEMLKPGDLSCTEFDWSEAKKFDKKQAKKINELINLYPKSEAGFYSRITREADGSDMVYLGNSLPIRMWDLVNDGDQPIHANRGANGIDGQVSTAMGLVESYSRNWIVLGDLTTLYDFSGFWMSPYLRKTAAQANLVVVNNEGGQIFSRIFDSPLFLNNHQLSFKRIAQMWGWSYQKIKGIGEFKFKSDLNLVEIVPNKEQTQMFWEKYDQLWNK